MTDASDAEASLTFLDIEGMYPTCILAVGDASIEDCGGPDEFEHVKMSDARNRSKCSFAEKLLQICSKEKL